MEIIDKINKYVNEANAKKLALIEELRTNFITLFLPLFDKSKGKITSFGWTQYTPYFNDGDECKFSTHFDYGMEINGVCEDEIENLDYRLEYYLEHDENYKNLLNDNPKLDVELYRLIQEIKNILKSIPDDFYKELFGDHTFVTITRDEITVEEYEHD